ncbi:hypothetical protein PLICRDRAFT_172982 [Plicaturopsis crispa FD-325 SS-3]|nr:hypothetical protein PLICRDRAFT_172982 [Plicaturopsis crispa FD-325 SS-3]
MSGYAPTQSTFDSPNKTANTPLSNGSSAPTHAESTLKRMRGEEDYSPRNAPEPSGDKSTPAKKRKVRAELYAEKLDQVLYRDQRR